MPADKHRFLSHMTMGKAAWGVTLARSEAEIEHHYPELTVVHQRLKWMSDDHYARICDQELHDIDGAPWGVLNVVLADRERR